MSKKYYTDSKGNILCHDSMTANEYLQHYRTKFSKNGYIQERLVDSARVAKGKIDAAGNYIYDKAQSTGNKVSQTGKVFGNVATNIGAYRNKNKLSINRIDSKYDRINSNIFKAASNINKAKTVSNAVKGHIAETIANNTKNKKLKQKMTKASDNYYKKGLVSYGKSNIYGGLSNMASKSAKKENTAYQKEKAKNKKALSKQLAKNKKQLSSIWK